MDEWRLIEETDTSKRWQRYVDGKPTNNYRLVAGACPTVDAQVGSSANDGYIDGSGFYSAEGASRVGRSFYLRNSWYRWTGITISGTIDVAYIELHCHDDDGIALTKIYAEDADNPSAPTSATDYNSRTTTTAAVDWDTPGTWATYAWHESPSLASIFQELVDSYTISNDAVQILHKDDGSGGAREVNAHAWDYDDHTLGAKLHIEYSTGESYKKVIDETEAVTEGSVRTGLAIIQFGTEVVALAEGIVRILPGMVKVISENEMVQETQNKAMGVIKAIAETEAITEGKVKAMGFVKLIAETAAITEAIVRICPNLIIKVISETLSIAEAIVKRAVSGVPALSVATRSTGLTLYDRSATLTLKSRSQTLTLEERS